MRRIIHVASDRAEASSRRHVLRSAGFEVVTVSDSATAELLAAEGEPADLIVLEPGSPRTPALKQAALNGVPVLDLDLGWHALAELSHAGELGLAVIALLRLNATEQALRESDARFRSVADAAPVLIWSSGVDGLRDYFNQPWLYFTGRSEQQEIGTGWQLGLYPPDRERYLQVYGEAFAARSEFEIEYRLLHRDAKHRWILERGVPRYTPDGVFAGYVGSCIDITERKSVEAERERLLAAQVSLRELAEAAQRKSRLLAEISDLSSAPFDSGPALEMLAAKVVPLLADCCVIDLLDAAGRPYRAGAAYSGSTSAAVHALLEPENYGAEGDAASSPVLQAVMSHKPVVVERVSAEWMRSLGMDADRAALLERLGVRSLYVVPFLAFGEPLGTASFVLTDPSRTLVLADVHLAQEVASRIALGLRNRMLFSEAESAREQAEKASRVKDDFLATISHEMRQPVHAISGWARLLKTGKLTLEKAAHAVSMIEQNVALQAQIVRDLLDVSAMVTGQFYLETQPMTLALPVRAAIESVRAAADAKGITLEADVDGDACRMEGDARRLQQAVWNLLYNAIKFTPRGGRVEVRLQANEREAQITVADNGPGIDASFLPHVFEHFRQQDSTTTRRHGGLGLGLAIVRRVAELHGGSVLAQNISERGGALFVLRFPLAPAPACERAAVDASR
jgi:PAS domain S-box-containing protein